MWAFRPEGEGRNRLGMTGWGFWAVAAGVALAVALVLIAAMRRTPDATTADDLAVYKDQLAEIERDLTQAPSAPEANASGLRSARAIEADRPCGGRDLVGHRADGVLGVDLGWSYPEHCNLLVAGCTRLSRTWRWFHGWKRWTRGSPGGLVRGRTGV